MRKASALSVERAGPHRPARFALLAAALALSAPFAAPTPAAAATSLAAPGIDDFYASRDGRPLWLAGQGAEPQILLGLLKSADADGLDPRAYDVRGIERALRAAWGGEDEALLRADRLLSRAFVAYVSDLRRAPDGGMIWVDPDLRPTPPDARALLESAAAAPSLEDYLASMRWMNPIYAELRRAYADGSARDAREAALLRLNIQRARLLPEPRGKYVIVNAGAQRLTMYEDDRIVDSMRVVVGKPVHPTPMMAAKIRFASLNPYWNVPPDLAAERVAPGALEHGPAWLRARGYQVLSTWDDDATVVDPATIDWKAVADGRTEVRVRQLPGPSNSMGMVKYMFPNDQGIYLHDTPQKELLSEASRMFSGGCVRLEDAARLGEWLFDRPLSAKGAKPEQRVDLPRPVPVFITYLTAMPAGGAIAYFDDIYGRDGPALGGLARDPLAPLAAR